MESGSPVPVRAAAARPRMLRRAILAAAVFATGITVAACGSGAGTTASPPPSCLHQYRSWMSGPAHAAGENLVVALNSVQAASSALDASSTGAALKRAAATAATLARYPMPACADPKGYWQTILRRVRAASASAGTSKDMGTLLIAEAPLKDMPVLERNLAGELTRTVPALNRR